MPNRKIRKWNDKFIEYMKFIVNHPNYRDMPNKFKKDGQIKWVSPSDKLRAEWWDKKKAELHLKTRAEAARYIFPTELKRMKPCQICGRLMSIDYIYPNKNTLIRLNKLSGEEFVLFAESIFDVFKKINNKNSSVYLIFKEVFNIPPEVFNDPDSYLKFIIQNRKTRLSPGVMSNPPDRLDGFHTYNACCRSQQDTGRSKANLARYSQDRRAYENWADGNFNLTNRLMGEYGKYSALHICPICGRLKKMTADHIGPISLGFTHRPKFNPLCKECNSTKNNRMSYKDVKTLINDEKNGDQVISWHSRPIWDRLKYKVNNQADALKLSRYMRINLHHVLILLSLISEKGYDSFLYQYLHPEYSFIDYKFVNFNPLDNKNLQIIEKPLDSANKRSNADRYLRIAFESLDEYKAIENRNTKIWQSKNIDSLVKAMFSSLQSKDNGIGKYFHLRESANVDHAEEA